MRTLSMRIVSYLIEYLGEFELTFETILDYESGDQMGSYDAKKPPSKISCLGTFKESHDTIKRHQHQENVEDAENMNYSQRPTLNFLSS
jgi:hypothetical protein